MFQINEDHPLLKVPMSNKVEDRVNGPANLPSDEDWNPDALARWSAWTQANQPQQASFDFEQDSIEHMRPMSPYKFSTRSWNNLQGVDPKLCVLMGRAIQYAPYDFMIIEGLRTEERQAELLRQGATTTMNSRHLTGHAVDIAIWHQGKVNWDFPKYKTLYKHIQEIADEEPGINITWGGNWKNFLDGPHYEITWGTD